MRVAGSVMIMLKREGRHDKIGKKGGEKYGDSKSKMSVLWE